jgi:hypothetical protein
MKCELLKDLKVTDYLQLENIKDYDLFFEFLLECYQEAQKEQITPLKHYETLSCIL